jgi:tyrosinase
MKTSLGYSFLYLITTSVLYVISIATPACGQGCRNIDQRKEIRDMTDAERNAYFDAIIQLQSGSRPTKYDELSQMHYNVRNTAHGWAWFFPWHRAFLMEFQRRLRTINRNIVLPYWDWSYDSQAPELAPIWQSDWYGGNGRSGDHCVVNGKFNQYRPFYPEDHCLQRQWDNGDKINAYYSPQALRDLIRNSRSYNTFRQRLEGVPHGQVHTSMGYDMSTMYSPNE